MNVTIKDTEYRVLEYTLTESHQYAYQLGKSEPVRDFGIMNLNLILQAPNAHTLAVYWISGQTTFEFAGSKFAFNALEWHYNEQITVSAFRVK